MDPGGQPAQLVDAGARQLDRLRAQLPRPLRIRRRPALGQPQLEHRADELLLGAVVQVALELRPRRVGGLDDPPPRDPQLLRPRLRDVAVARHLLGAALLLDVR